MSSEKNKQSDIFWFKNYLHPRYWLVLFSLSLLWLVSKLPYAMQMHIGSALGRLLYYIMPWNRTVIETNTDLIFPEWSAEKKRRFVKQNFRSLGKTFFETSLCWWGSDKQLAPLCHIDGLENLHNALDKGKGVILLSAHFTCLEIGGRLLTMHQPYCAIYKSSKNPLYERMLKRSRELHITRAIKREDIRSFLKILKENNAVWYAPDRDFGLSYSVFAPFMGVMAATLTAPARIAKMSGSLVVPFFTQRLDNNKGYKLTILPALENYPVGDEVQDAMRINEVIETQVKKVPEQYLWAHTRFKTRPEGEPPIYPERKRFRKKKRTGS